MGWNEQETRLYNTLISSAGIIGLAFGSFLGGKLISDGRRRASLIMNTVAIFGSLLCMHLSVWSLCLGRVINGLTSGVMNVIMGKCIDETFEGFLASRLSMFTNICICFGVTFAMNLGFMLPPVGADQEELKADQMWRVIFLMPAFISIIEIFLYIGFVREEPITFSIMSFKDKQAKNMMSLIYKVDAETEQEKEELFSKKISLKQRTTSMDSSSTTFKAAVCGKKFRKASWVCFFINTFNQQSGINAINVYAGRLLQTMDNESNGTFPISVTVGT